MNLSSSYFSSISSIDFAESDCSNLSSFSFGIPFDVLDGERFLASGAGDGGTQYEFEATYFYPLTDNIDLVPAFYLVANPNNFGDNPSIYVFNLRTQFRF